MGARFPYGLPSGWFQVARLDELEPGAVKPLRYFNRDLVLFRGASGAVQLLDAHCPHLGAHLGHGGRVEGDEIVCPFHAWQFDGAGRCTKIPYSDKIPRQAALTPWTTVEKKGKGTGDYNYGYDGTSYVGYDDYSRYVLRLHLALETNDLCALRVDNETRVWEEGKALVTDILDNHRETFKDMIAHYEYNLNQFNNA